MAPVAETGGVFRHAFADGLEGWEVVDVVAEPGEWLGRRAARLSKGGVLLAPFTPEPPYAVELTLAGGAGESYVGACFHLQDAQNYEAVYLAPHLGGQMEAIQYDAALHGSMTWQVFSGPDTLAPAPLQRERWHELRLEVWPDVVHVYMDAPEADEGSAAAARQPAAAPAATFALRTGFTGRCVGVWSYLPCYVAELAIRALTAPRPAVPPLQRAPSGTVGEWLVGNRVIGSEANGTLCFNRLASIDAGVLTAVCEVLVPEGARHLSLELGYSDRATVWWDDHVVHEGEWRWNPKAGADGRVRLGHVTVPLHTVATGWHALRAEVAASEPFGWGLNARVLADGVPCETRTAAGEV